MDVDKFNDHFTAALLALAESKVGFAFHNYRSLAELAASTLSAPPSLPTRDSRRAGKQPSSTSSRAGSSTRSDAMNPFTEMVLVVRDKLGGVLVRSLTNINLDIEEAKSLWRMSAMMGLDDGTTLFGQRLTQEFAEAARELVKTVKATQVFRSVVGASGAINSVGEEQPFVAVITDVLSLAMEWFDGVMAECLEDGTPLPNKFRTAIVVQLHQQCTKLVMPLLMAYLEAIRITELIDSVLSGPPGGGRERSSPYIPASMSPVNTASSWEAAVAGATGRAVMRSGPSSTGVSVTPAGSGPSSNNSRSQQSSPAVAEPSPVDVWMARVNEVCDQLSFMCRILERYLRAVTVALLLGAEDQGSQLRDDLTSKLQELIGHYVILERAYVQWGTTKASSESYRVPLDDKIEVYSWADDLLFLCKKALDRSIGTQCLLAAQATLNNVYALLEDASHDLFPKCLAVCSFVGSLSGVSRSGRDDADLRLNAALSGLLVSDEHSPVTCAVAALNSLDAGSDYIFSLLKWLYAILESEFASSFKTFGPTLSELESLGNRFKDCCEEAAGSLAHGLFAKWSEPLVRSLRRIVLVLKPDEFDRLSAHDPLSDTIDSILDNINVAKLAEQLSSNNINRVFPALSLCFTAEFETAVRANQLNELGALRLQAVSRGLFDALSSFVTNGSMRQKWQRWNQCLSVWTMEKLPDIYTLRFPTPILPPSELKGVLRGRVDFNPLGIDGIAFDRLTCVAKPKSK